MLTWEGLDGEIFDLLFNSAELSKFAPKERKEYIKEMTTERDRANQLAFAERKGMEKGARKKALDMAAKLLAKGMTMDDVAEAAGLSVEELSNELS